MNLWGFHESFLAELKNRFPAFLDEALVNNPLKGEYFLPSVVEARWRKEKRRCRC